MSFGKQYVDVYTTWVEQQVKIGQGFVEAVQAIDIFDPSLVWDKTLDAYQASIQSTLDAEVAGARLYFEDVAGIENLPEDVLKVVDYSKNITEQLTNAQQSLVNTSFEFLRKVDVKGFVVELPQAPPVKKTAKAQA